MIRCRPTVRRGRLAGDRVLVATGPDAQAEQLMRAGKRLADALDADWTVVYVETPALLKLSEAQRNRRIELLRLAESLGAETVTLDGPTAAAVLGVCATRHVTRSSSGSPKRLGWRALLRPSTATELARPDPGLRCVPWRATARPAPAAADCGRLARAWPARVRWSRYALGGGGRRHLHRRWRLRCSAPRLVNLVMVYLLGVTVAGLRLGRGPSVLTSVLNVGVLRFLLRATALQFRGLRCAVPDHLRRHADRLAGHRDPHGERAPADPSVRGPRATHGLAVCHEPGAGGHAWHSNMCRGGGAPRGRGVPLPGRGTVAGCQREAALSAGPAAGASLRGADLAVAQWVADHGRQAGLGTDTLPAAAALYVPLGDDQRALGVLAVLPENRRRVMLPEQRHLLETFAGQTGLALERALLAEQAEAARVSAEGESLRNTLLASISHDLRTPLAVMAGAGSTLAEHGASLDESHPGAPRALHRDQGAGNVRPDFQCPRPDALRVRADPAAE